MITALLLAAAQPATPAPPPADGGKRTVVREVIVSDAPAGSAAAKDDKGKEERREIVIIRHGYRAKAAGANGEERREVRILRGSGSAGERATMIECGDGAKVDSEAVDKDGRKTRVMICAGGGSSASRIQQLRDAAKRIQSDTNLSEEARTRIALAINEAIARLPASE